MKIIDNDEMLAINGGVALTGTMLNAIIKGISTLLEVGRSFGTAIRMYFSKRKC